MNYKQYNLSTPAHVSKRFEGHTFTDQLINNTCGKHVENKKARLKINRLKTVDNFGNCE